MVVENDGDAGGFQLAQTSLLGGETNCEFCPYQKYGKLTRCDIPPLG